MVFKMSIKKCLLILSAAHVALSTADACNEDFCLTDNYVKTTFDRAQRWDRSPSKYNICHQASNCELFLHYKRCEEGWFRKPWDYYEYGHPHGVGGLQDILQDSGWFRWKIWTLVNLTFEGRHNLRTLWSCHMDTESQGSLSHKAWGSYHIVLIFDLCNIGNWWACQSGECGTDWSMAIQI